MTKEKIARINELAKKSKTPAGLTEAEQAEQAALRQEYVAEMKASLRAQLEHTMIQEPDGTLHKLGRRPQKRPKIKGPPRAKGKILPQAGFSPSAPRRLVI